MKRAVGAQYAAVGNSANGERNELSKSERGNCAWVENSRFLYGCTYPVLATIESVMAVQSSTGEWLRTLRVRWVWVAGSCTGGVAALDHRLMAVNPAGSGGMPGAVTGALRSMRGAASKLADCQACVIR